MPTFPSPQPVTVDARLPGGTFHLIAEERDTVEVEVLPDNNSDSSRQAAAETTVDLHGDTLRIHAPELHGWLIRRAPRLRVTARMPAGSPARIRTMSADVEVVGRIGATKLNTAGGNATLAHVDGDLAIKSASGNLRATQISGRLIAHSASGDLMVDQVGGAVEIKSASGDARIGRAGGDVTVRSASGDLWVDSARQGTVNVTTVSGDVIVGVEPGTGVWLDLNSLSGRAVNELSMTEEAAADHRLTIAIRSVSGDITVRRAVGAPSS